MNADDLFNLLLQNYYFLHIFVFVCGQRSHSVNKPMSLQLHSSKNITKIALLSQTESKLTGNIETKHIVSHSSVYIGKLFITGSLQSVD